MSRPRDWKSKAEIWKLKENTKKQIEWAQHKLNMLWCGAQELKTQAQELKNTDSRHKKKTKQRWVLNHTLITKMDMPGAVLTQAMLWIASKLMILCDYNMCDYSTTSRDYQE